MRDNHRVHYRIDDRDRLVSVNDAWVSQAEEIPEPGLAPPIVLGRGIWQLIGDPSIRHLFDRLFQRLRAGEVPEVSYFFRCDTPELRRLHRLTITTGAGHTLDFQSDIVAIDPRARVSLLDPGIPRSDELLSICSWCKRIPLPGGRWGEVEEALGELDILDRGRAPSLSHGICPACERSVDTLIERPGGEGSGPVKFGEWPTG